MINRLTIWSLTRQTKKKFNYNNIEFKCKNNYNTYCEELLPFLGKEYMKKLKEDSSYIKKEIICIEAKVKNSCNSNSILTMAFGSVITIINIAISQEIQRNLKNIKQEYPKILHGIIGIFLIVLSFWSIMFWLNYSEYNEKLFDNLCLKVLYKIESEKSN